MPCRPTFLACFASLAATGSLGASGWLVETWDTDDGLPQNSVVSLAQTDDGMLWIGTQLGGLASFDGARFVTYDPSNTPALRKLEIYRMMTAGDGTMWISQVGGALTRWRDGEFEHVRGEGIDDVRRAQTLVYADPDRAMFSLPGGDLLQVNSGGEWEEFNLGDAQGNPMVAHPDGGGRIYYRKKGLTGVGWWQDGQSGEVPTTKGKTVSVMAADADSVWFGTGAGFGQVIEGEAVDPIPDATGRIETMVFADDGALWVGGDWRLRRFVDGKLTATAKLKHAPAPEIGPVELVELIAAPDGGVWFRHRSKGVWHVTREGIVSNPGAADGLPGGLVECALVDREGSLWLGFNGGGLARLRPRMFEVPRTPDGPPPVVRSICEDSNGSLWMGHYDGRLLQRTGDEIKEWPLLRPPAESATPSLLREVTAWPGPDGELWIGSVGNGAWRIRDGELERPFPPEDIGTVVRAGLCDREGRVWMGSEFGLFVWEDDKLRKFTDDDGFWGKFVASFAEDKDGAIWIGTAGGRLWRWDGQEFEMWKLPDTDLRFRFWSLLADDDGTVWIGTLAGGLLRWRDGELRRATSADGLPSDTITQILTDDGGTLWLGSRKGIFSVPKDELHEFFDGARDAITARSFGLSDGLPAMECSSGSQPACWKAKDGRLWFATVKGAVAIDPENIPFNPLPPTVLIEQLHVDGQPVPTKDTVALPPGPHSFELQFTATSLIAPKKVRFQWRLDGLETDWVDGGNARSVRYGSLGPGDYTFRVRASNNDGVWNETGAQIAMSIAPHYWQTLWFRLGMMALGALAIWWVLHLRHHRQLDALARKEALNAERTRIARDLHDDLGASLTQLNWMCETEATPHREIGSKARSMVRSIDEIVWAVNPHHDSVDGLAHYIGQFAEDFLHETPIRCRLDIDDSFPDTPIASSVRHDAFLIAREAIHNAAKHSGASEISVAIHATGDRLAIEIVDDGQGFDLQSDTRGSGNGLRNMRARAETLGSELEIETAPGEGCRVRFRVPLRVVA